MYHYEQVLEQHKQAVARAVLSQDRRRIALERAVVAEAKQKPKLLQRVQSVVDSVRAREGGRSSDRLTSR